MARLLFESTRKESFPPHFAHLMLQSGVDPATVAALLGHTDAVMLCRTYLHMGSAVDHLRETLMRVSSGAA
jgi:site-specific recombinase XerD